MENQNEIWKDVVNYQGHYMMSTNGDVKSLKLGTGKIMKPSLARGYYQVCLYLNGNGKSRDIHQLMAETFYGHVPCGHKLVVDHIDTNKLNNKLDNLRIISQRENANRKHLKSTSQYTGVHWSKEKNKWVSTICVNGKNKNLGIFDSEKEASEYYENALKNHLLGLPIEVKKINYSSNYTGICKIENGNRWLARKYINSKCMYIGRFKTEIEAYNAYQDFEKTLKK